MKCRSCCHSVVATCRNPDGAEGLQQLAQRHGSRLSIVRLDATDEESIQVIEGCAGQNHFSAHAVSTGAERLAHPVKHCRLCILRASSHVIIPCLVHRSR